MVYIWIHVPPRIPWYVSMFHYEMLSTGRLYADEMLNECLLNVFTILLTLESCSSMKRCGIRSPHTVKYSSLHAIGMYLIVFMVNKSLSGSESESEWRFNERDGVSNHQPHDCLLNCLFSRRSKKTSKPRVTGFREGNSLMTGEFSAQRDSKAENISIWWRHHGYMYNIGYCMVSVLS